MYGKRNPARWGSPTPPGGGGGGRVGRSRGYQRLWVKVARLCTNHDPCHAHALLGVPVSLRFMDRVYCWFRFGVTSPTEEPLAMSTGLVLLHGALALRAFPPPVPHTRSSTAPTIWPEFRMGNSPCAMWHVWATLRTVHVLWPEGVVSTAAVRFSLLAWTTSAASLVTHRYGDSVHRTTNCMP